MFDLPPRQDDVNGNGNGRVRHASNGNGHQPEIAAYDRDELNGKVALIIGTLTADAQDLARALAYHGAEVALIYQPNDQLPARRTAQSIREMGKQCLLIPIPPQGDYPRSAVQRAADHFGQLDIYIDYSVTWRRQTTDNVFFPTAPHMATALRHLVSS
jgi:enoyl-[acyl-carrier-protein] reductase (NADH)